MESEETLATKIDNCTRRESELRKQIDQDSEEKAVVGQKVKFVQIELNQIQQEFTSLDEHISHSEEELKSLKWHQVDIWDQQQSSDTLIHQKSHKDWLLVEQKQAKVDTEQQLYLVEQQVLQSVANDLQEEKLEIEVKRDEVRRETHKLNWDVQQLQREISISQEQVESVQVSIWHHLAGLQTLKEDFHDAEQTLSRAQLDMHLLEDKISDLEDFLTLPVSERELLAARRTEFQRRLEAGKQQDSRLRMQLQSQEKLIRDILMNKIKLDREWQRHLLQQSEKERCLSLVLAEIAYEEQFIHEQESTQGKQLQLAIEKLANDCDSALPKQIADLQQQEDQLMNEIAAAEEQVQQIRSHLVHQDLSIHDLQTRQLQDFRRKEIETSHSIQQLRRQVQCLTERQIPLAQLHLQRVLLHEQLLVREKTQEIEIELQKAQEDVKEAESSIYEVSNTLSIELGVLKAARKHHASLLAHTPEFLREAESQVENSQSKLDKAKSCLLQAQTNVEITRKRQQVVEAKLNEVTTQVSEAKQQLQVLQEDLSEQEAAILTAEQQHESILRCITSVEQEITSRVNRMDTIHIIGEVDALPRYLQLQQDVLPKLQCNLLTVQATLHSQHLRHERFYAAWEGFQTMINEVQEKLHALRTMSITLQSNLDCNRPDSDFVSALLQRMREVTIELNQARVMRDRILSSIRETDQDAVHVPQHRLQFAASSASDYLDDVRQQLMHYRQQFVDAKQLSEQYQTTSTGITLKMKRLAAEIRLLWKEKLQINLYNVIRYETSSKEQQNWVLVLQEKQMRLRTLQAQERHWQGMEKHLWTTRLNMVLLHQRQLVQDMHELHKAKPLSMSQVQSQSLAMSLSVDASSLLASTNTRQPVIALGMTSLSQSTWYRQQQQQQQQLHRVLQDITEATQSIAQHEQRRFLLTREWQEKIRLWQSWNEQEQHLTQSLRHMSQELQQTRQLHLNLQRVLTEKKHLAQLQQQQQEQQRQQQQQRIVPVKEPLHLLQPRSGSRPSSPSQVSPKYLAAHPNPYPNYLSGSRPSSPARLSSDSPSRMRSASSELDQITYSHRGSPSGWHGKSSPYRPASSGASSKHSSRPGSTTEFLDNADGIDKDVHELSDPFLLLNVSASSNGAENLGLERDSPTHRRHSKHSQAANNDEDDDSDIHTLQSQEDLAPTKNPAASDAAAHSVNVHHAPIANGAEVISNAKRATSPSFIAGSVCTVMTPKTTGLPKGLTPERPLRVSLNRSWSNQSLTKKMSKSTVRNNIIINGSEASTSNNSSITAKPTKKVVAMMAARQQQTQESESKRRIKQQAVAASFQF
jgi:hypothetical protein